MRLRDNLLGNRLPAPHHTWPHHHSLPPHLAAPPLFASETRKRAPRVSLPRIPETSDSGDTDIDATPDPARASLSPSPPRDERRPCRSTEAPVSPVATAAAGIADVLYHSFPPPTPAPAPARRMTDDNQLGLRTPLPPLPPRSPSPSPENRESLPPLPTPSRLLRPLVLPMPRSRSRMGGSGTRRALGVRLRPWRGSYRVTGLQGVMCTR